MKLLIVEAESPSKPFFSNKRRSSFSILQLLNLLLIPLLISFNRILFQTFFALFLLSKTYLPDLSFIKYQAIEIYYNKII